jgi:glycosyltransferase involved in cell wall biosynthesis
VWCWRDFYDYPRLNRLLDATASVSVAISNSILTFAANQLGSRSKLRLVLNGVHDLKANELPGSDDFDAPSLFRVDSDDIICTIVGQLIPRKGHARALRAFAEAIKSVPRIRLVLAFPEGELLARGNLTFLKNLVQVLKCGDRVTFAGCVKDIARLLKESDFVIVPSEREPCGRIAVEAMLMKRAVLAFHTDALEEIVADGQTGLLVPAGNINCLMDAIICLANNPHMRRMMGVRGRIRAIDLFSCKRMAAEMGDLYRSLVSNSI